MSKSSQVPVGADNIFWSNKPVNLTSTDHVHPTSGFYRGLNVSGTGRVTFQMFGGGDVAYVIPDSSKTIEIRGYAIAKIYKATTTCSVTGALE